MKIVAIGDTHMQWMHKPTFDKIIELIKFWSPDYVVQVGDLFDFFSWSRFPKNTSLITPQEELHCSRLMAENFWKLVHLAAKKAKLYQIKGNHCDRVIKRTSEMAPELIPFVGPQLHKIYEFDNVKTIHDSTDELIIEDILFMHGFRTKLGLHCIHNQMNTVHGHSHRGGVFFYPTIKGRQIWELDVGHIADPSADPLRSLD